MAQDNSAEIDFFNVFCKGYEVFTEKAYRRVLEVFAAKARPRDAERIIDLGCGSGAFTGRIASSLKNNKVFGIDISQVLLRKARCDRNDIGYIAGDIKNIPCRDKVFDIAVLSAALHHFDDLTVVLTEANRLLRMGGRCFAFDPNNASPLMWLYRNKASPFFSSDGITPNERLLTRNELRSSFASCGFDAEVFAIGGMTYKYISEKKLSFLMPVYNLFEEMSLASPLVRKFGSFLISVGTKRRDL